MARAVAAKRLTKELQTLTSSPPEGIRLLKADDLEKWTVSLQIFGNTLYAGDSFTVQFKFSPQYPIDSPEVTFINNIPIHPHIYSNGHICLDILGDAWSPILNVSTVCISLQSMLASNTKKERPPDNSMYIMRASGGPKNTRFVYHDDAV